jgi:hypothetical protein
LCRIIFLRNLRPVPEYEEKSMKSLLKIAIAAVLLSAPAYAGDTLPVPLAMAQKIEAQFSAGTDQPSADFRALQTELQTDQVTGLFQCTLSDGQPYQGEVAYILHCWQNTSAVVDRADGQMNHEVNIEANGYLVTNFEGFTAVVQEAKKTGDGFVPLLHGKSSSSGGLTQQDIPTTGKK